MKDLELPDSSVQLEQRLRKLEDRTTGLATTRRVTPIPIVVRTTIDVAAPDPREQHLIPVPAGDFDCVAVGCRFDGASNAGGNSIVRLRCDGETSAAFTMSVNFEIGAVAIAWKRPGGGNWPNAGAIFSTEDATGELLELVLEVVDSGSPGTESALSQVTGSWFRSSNYPEVDASEAGTVIEDPFSLTP